MKQLKFLEILLVLKIVTMAVAREELMAVPEPAPNLSEITANIINSCYGKSMKEIGLVGERSDSFIVAITSDDQIATILLNSNKKPENSGPVSRQTRRPLLLFVVTASSSVELESVLLNLRNSRWWNHMAQFYFFNPFGNDTTCSEAFGFLWTAWKLDVLGAKFICNDDADGPLIYAFNPYTEYAPKPWALEKIHRGINDHPWALLVRKYHEKTDNCANIDFDRTRDIGGYEVRITLEKGGIAMNYTKTGRFSLNDLTNSILQRISQYFNATLKMVACGSEPLGYFDSNGKAVGRLRYLTDDISDLLYVGVPLDAIAELPGLYGFVYQRLFSVTQYTAYLTQWEKVISALDRPSRIALCIVILINIITLKYLLRHSFMISVLNTVRVICNSCFTKLPKNLASRIYLAGLFCCVIVIQALFQGQLSALLAKQVRFPNINSYQDLVNSDYIIYGWYEHRNFFDDPAFDGRFKGIDSLNDNCTDYVLLNSSIACVGSKYFMIDHAIKMELHMSKRPVIELPVTFLIRKDWPLEERMNRHLSHYFESGLLVYDYEAAYVDKQRTLESNENRGGDENFKILTLPDLNFAFFILGVGLGSATVSFLVECYVGRSKRSSKVEIFGHPQPRIQFQFL